MTIREVTQGEGGKVDRKWGRGGEERYGKPKRNERRRQERNDIMNREGRRGRSEWTSKSKEGASAT